MHFSLLRFRVSVNTEAETSVMFYLVYEELLARHSGIYQYTVIIISIIIFISIIIMVRLTSCPS